MESTGKSEPVLVELGVLEGELSFGLYDRGWEGAHFVLIDPWAPHPNCDTVGERQRMDAMYEHVKAEALKRDEAAFQIHRLDGLEARQFSHPDAADVVYIDYFYNKPIYRRVLSAWWSVVRPGGILAGHDFARYPEIEEAVRAFAAMHRLDIGLLPDTTSRARLDELRKGKDAWQRQIWWIQKPEAAPEPEPEPGDEEGEEDIDGDT